MGSTKGEWRLLLRSKPAFHNDRLDRHALKPDEAHFESDLDGSLPPSSGLQPAGFVSIQSNTKSEGIVGQIRVRFVSPVPIGARGRSGLFRWYTARSYGVL